MKTAKETEEKVKSQEIEELQQKEKKEKFVQNLNKFIENGTRIKKEAEEKAHQEKIRIDKEKEEA